MVDPAGTAFDGSHKFYGSGFSDAIYSKFHMNAIDMKGSRHALDVKTGEAVWNPHVDEVLGGIVHAVGP